MTSFEARLDRAERAVELGEHDEALAAVLSAQEAAGEPAEVFRSLLLRARLEAETFDDAARALATYERARELSRDEHLDRGGEAELGAASCLLELRRPEEACRRLQRAAAAFRRTGDALRRGCAELLLAEEAARVGDDHRSELHLQVATDLLLAAGEPRLLSAALSLGAELASRDEREDEARELLERARAMAVEVADEAARGDLMARRREIVRTWLAAGIEL